jgi:hypothetical protein
VDWKDQDETSEVIEVIDLSKDNNTPKGLVPIENIFNRHDMYKQKVETTKTKVYMEINIG